MLISRARKIGLLGIAVCLLAAIVALQADIDPKRHQFEPGRGPITVGGKASNLMLEMPSQMLAATMIGLREVVAGLLWVRADEFFHTGNYDAIVPLVRLITWLDPHQLDVYMVGAWHLDYNFVDTDQRSDRRYVPASIALLREGIKNNSKVYDLYFELGWVHYFQKIKDFDKAAYWIERSRHHYAADPDTGKPEDRPALVDRMLAHAYERAGNIEMAKKSWREAIAYSRYLLRKHPGDVGYQLDLNRAQANYDLTLLREVWRKTGTKPVIDVKFNPTVKRIAPKVLEVSGTVDIVSPKDYLAAWPGEKPGFVLDRLRDYGENTWLDGARIDVVLADRDYKAPVLKSFSWVVDKNATICVDSAYIGEGKFKVTLDMSKDPNIYPLRAEKYRLVLSFNPLTAPDYIQDRIGWWGEGITDKKCLDTKTKPGVRMLKKVYELRREDII